VEQCKLRLADMRVPIGIALAHTCVSIHIIRRGIGIYHNLMIVYRADLGPSRTPKFRTI
jgi:hypothetical protein